MLKAEKFRFTDLIAWLLKILAVIQCTSEDVISTNPDDTCISVLKKSELFDDIVLAVPKLGNYSIFEGLSKKWNVDLLFGSNYNGCEFFGATSPPIKVLDNVTNLTITSLFSSTVDDLILEIAHSRS